MSPYRVLLVDPVRHRRDRAVELLRSRFEIEAVGSKADALAWLAANEAHAIVITLRQVDENGLVVAKALREKVGKQVLLVVHGPTTPATPTNERQIVATHHQVDAWLPTALEPQGIEAVVWNTLDRRHRPREAAARRGLLTRLRSVTRRDVWHFLTRPRHLIPTPPRAPDEEPGWIELLNSPPTLANIKAILTKPIGSPRPRAG